MLGLDRARWLEAALLAVFVAAGCADNPNHPPAIAGVTAAPNLAAPGGTVTIAVAASDPDGDKLTFAWNLPAGWTAAGGTSDAVIQLTAPAAYAESALVGVTVSDSRGGKTSGQALVATVAGEGPAFAAITATPNPLVPGGTATLVAVATTKLGGDVTYAWTVSDPAWQIAGATASAVVTAPLEYAATASATVVADDGHGNQSTARIALSTIPSSAPVIGSLRPSSWQVDPAGTITITADVWHPENLGMTYAWTVSDPAWTITGAGPTATLKAPNALGTSTVVTLTVTDEAHASTQSSVEVSTVDRVRPVAVIGGTSPVHGTVNHDLLLDGSGSYSPVGNPIRYRWSVETQPAGASITWRAPDGITVVNPPELAQVNFRGDTPGAYDVRLYAYDAAGSDYTGSLYAHVQVILDGENEIVVVSGDAQTGTVDRDLPQPLVVKVQTTGASPAPVPGAALGWSLGGGRRFGGVDATDGAGQAWLGVHPSRIAGAGTVRVWLKENPAVTKTLSFTAAADKAAFIAVVGGVGTTSQGFNVKVQTVDQYGNLALDNTLNNAATFQLDIVGSATAKFTQTGNGHLAAALVNGQFQTAVTDTLRESFRIVASAGTTGIRDLPFGYIFPVVNDNAERGLSYGGYWPGATWSWTRAAGGNSPPWQMVTGAGKVQSGGQAFGVELQPSGALMTGYSSLASALSVATTFEGHSAPLWRLDLSTKVELTSLTDTTAKCARQAALAVGGFNGGSFLPLAPQGGYPAVELCHEGESPRGESLGATSGFVPLTFDVTDLRAGGLNHPQPGVKLTQPAQALTGAAQAVRWYVDDVRVTVFVADDTYAGARSYILPGAATKVQFATSGASYGPCLAGGIAVAAEIQDANSNVTQDAFTFEIDWNGRALLDSVTAGTLVEYGPRRALVAFAAGQGALSLTDAVSETVRFTLANPLAYPGITVGPYLDSSASVCHTTGTGYQWTDHTPLGTFDVTQALRACQAHYGAGACASDGSAAYAAVGALGCSPNHVWTYATSAAYSSVCGGAPYLRTAGRVTDVYWLSICSCTPPGTVGNPANAYPASVDFSAWQ
ncbi:MAG TPA: hypothetical protein VGQ83_19025 [Polyangia bacterium]|jgi:hypothetical protein